MNMKKVFFIVKCHRDSDLASIGTANMDMRSFHLNFEVNAFYMIQIAFENLFKTLKMI